MHRLRLAASAMSLIVVAAGSAACGDDAGVHTLHGNVSSGIELALFDTAHDRPYLLSVAPLCTDRGIQTTITSVRLSNPISGSMRVMNWGVQDSDTIRPGDPMQPGGIPGVLADFPKYGHHLVRNPCSDTSRVTDLVVQVERTSRTTSGVRGVDIRYRTAHGDGQTHVTEQLALCVTPNRDRMCHQLDNA